MTPFDYRRVSSPDEVLPLLNPTTRLLAGGTNLVDLLRIGVEQPATVVNIEALPLTAIEDMPDGGLRLGALVRLSDAAEHPALREGFPMLRQALLATASPQIRNRATLGGNLLQRTRCGYFRDLAAPCNRRQPGSGCGALAGEHRRHAILGGSDHCIATHPSDLAVALVALDAVVGLHSPRGERAVPLSEFYCLPGTTPQRETVRADDELITAIAIPGAEHARRSLYLKLRDRAAFEFALVSAAVGLGLSDGVVQSARIALGGVGTVPWRAQAAEQVLTGRPVDVQVFAEAADAALSDAQPHPQNAYKVALTRRVLRRALAQVCEDER